MLILCNRSACLSSLSKSEQRYTYHGHIEQSYLSIHSEHVRAGCDLMHVFFMFDEYSDRSTPSEVRKQKEVIMDALWNPHTPRPKEEWIGGEIVRQ